MSAFYEAVGRLWVGYIRQRYAAQLRAAAIVGVLGIVGLALGAVLASRPGSDED